MALSRMADQIGRVLGGRYRLLSPLGAGASAQVYLADDVRLRRRVAVKILHAGLADDDSFLRRFRAEAQASAALNHPHIVAVYDWSGDEGTPFLVTEYLSGGSLRSVLDGGHRLSPSQALVIGLEAARALDHAHRQGFVHRDIKPANLLFGADARLRIADFGLARAIAEAAWTEPQGAVLGTARYASPEQARGEPVDGRSDVYSLALVLVESVTGQVPFQADTTIGTLMARLDHPIDVPEELGALVPAIEAAGTLDPAERADADTVGRLLVAAAEDLPRPEPVPLTGPSQTAPLRKDPADMTLLPPGSGAAAGAAAAAGLATGAPPAPGTPGGPVGAGTGGFPANGGTRAPGPLGGLSHGFGGAPTGVVPVAPAGPGPGGGPGDRTDTFQLAPPNLGAPHGPGIARPSGDAHAPPGSPPEYSPLAAGARAPRRWITVVAVVVALLLGAAGAVLFQRSSVPSHEVPGGLVGRQYSEINDYVGEFGWRIVPQDTRRDDTVAGEILATEPAAGESLREGEELVVTRSLGPTLVDVPTGLEGSEREEAEQALVDAQLVAEVQEEHSDEVDEGLVIRVGDVGEQAPKGSAVPIVVSLGPEPRVVPDGIVGMGFDEARTTLEGMGMQVERRVEDDAEGAEDEVVEVDPGEGEEVDDDETVTLSVVSGTTEVPDVSDMDLSDARQALEDEGLDPGAVIGRGDGTVLGTFPSAGDSVPTGTQVQIFMR